jgi:hypothetical protein
MDKNRVKRREVPGKLAKDSKAQKGSKQLHVNAARIEGKLSTKQVSSGRCFALIRGDLSEGTEVSRGHSSRGENPDEGPNGQEVGKKGVGGGEDSRNLPGTGQAWKYP